MTMPFEPHHVSRLSPWSDPASSRSYLVAVIRAAAISLVLLVLLAVLVIF